MKIINIIISVVVGLIASVTIVAKLGSSSGLGMFYMPLSVILWLVCGVIIYIWLNKKP